MPRPRSTSLGLFAAAVVAFAGCSPQPSAPDPVRAVKTMTVATESTGATYEFAAEVRARTESRLSFRVGGKVVRRLVDLGSVVKAGQALAQLDPQDLRLSRDAARAALNAAEANLDQASADTKRFRELRDQGFISSAELERRETALKAAQSQVETARAQLSVQGNQTTYSTLVADANGVVTGVDAEPGMVVAAGAPVLRLAHDGPRDVVFSVPEDRIAMLRALAARPGALQVRIWGNGSDLLAANVREVAAAADPVTRTFLVKADIGRHDVALGQTAAVLLSAPRQSGVVKLPLSAVRELQGRSTVWLLDPTTMTVRPQTVQVAGADGNAVVIGGGLNAGQIVVTAGVHVLTPGQKVKLYTTGPGPAAAAAN